MPAARASRFPYSVDDQVPWSGTTTLDVAVRKGNESVLRARIPVVVDDVK